MKNYKLTIDYDGTRYLGWEHQKNNPMTIQGKLQSVLSQLQTNELETTAVTPAKRDISTEVSNVLPVGTGVKVIGTSRTDSGVHARDYVANVHLETDQSPEEIRSYLNHYLPEDIAVTGCSIVDDRFHARLNAKGKTYRYTCYVGQDKPVFERKYCHTLDTMPDLEAMKKAAAYLIGTHDFASFCGNPKMKKSTVRQLYRIDFDLDGDFLYITYYGQGFLQYMVRILTGTLLEVGTGKRNPESMPALLEAKKRALAGSTAPAKGLCLIKVHYTEV